MTSIPSFNQVTTFQRTDDASPETTQRTFLEFRTVMAEQFEDWRELPEEERVRHTYLEAHGLTETDLDNLSDQDRAAHEEKIAGLSKPLVFSTYPFSGSQSGDAMTRAVITLQSVLDSFEIRPSAPGNRTGSAGGD